MGQLTTDKQPSEESLRDAASDMYAALIAREEHINHTWDCKKAPICPVCDNLLAQEVSLRIKAIKKAQGGDKP